MNDLDEQSTEIIDLDGVIGKIDEDGISSSSSDESAGEEEGEEVPHDPIPGPTGTDSPSYDNFTIEEATPLIITAESAKTSFLHNINKSKKHARMSVSDMSDALHHLKEINWKGIPKHGAYINLNNITTKLHNTHRRTIVVNALYILDTHNRLKNASKIADYFTQWKMKAKYISHLKHSVPISTATVTNGLTGIDESGIPSIIPSSIKLLNKTPKETVKYGSSSDFANRILLNENEKLKASIAELAEKIKYDRDIPKLQAQGSKNIIVIYMKQSLRKKMESGFNHWYWITKRVITKKFLDRKMMLLRQEKQKFYAKEFQFGQQMSTNKQLTNTIHCSHAFFRWKITCIKTMFLEEREKEMGIQRYIYEEIKNLKVQLFEKNEKNKGILKRATTSGRNLEEKLQNLRDSVHESVSLTEDINIECDGGKIVPILHHDASNAKKKPSKLWSMLREHMGIDAEEARRLNAKLQLRKQKGEQ